MGASGSTSVRATQSDEDTKERVRAAAQRTIDRINVTFDEFDLKRRELWVHIRAAADAHATQRDAGAQDIQPDDAVQVHLREAYGATHRLRHMAEYISGLAHWMGNMIQGKLRDVRLSDGEREAFASLAERAQQIANGVTKMAANAMLDVDNARIHMTTPVTPTVGAASPTGVALDTATA